MEGVDLNGVVKGKSEGSITIDANTYSLKDGSCSEKLSKIINFFKLNDKVVYTVKNGKLVYIAKAEEKPLLNTMPLNGNANSGEAKQHGGVETKTGGGGITPRYTVPEMDKRTVRMNALRHASVEIAALLSPAKNPSPSNSLLINERLLYELPISLKKVSEDTLFLAKKYEKYILEGEGE